MLSREVLRLRGQIPATPNGTLLLTCSFTVILKNLKRLKKPKPLRLKKNKWPKLAGTTLLQFEKVKPTKLLPLTTLLPKVMLLTGLVKLHLLLLATKAGNNLLLPPVAGNKLVCW